MCFLSTFWFGVIWRKKVVPTEVNGHEQKDTCTIFGMQLTYFRIYCSSWRCLCVIYIHLKHSLLQDACMVFLFLWCTWDFWKCFWSTEKWDRRLLWSRKWYAFWFFHLSLVSLICSLCNLYKCDVNLNYCQLQVPSIWSKSMRVLKRITKLYIPKHYKHINQTIESWLLCHIDIWRQGDAANIYHVCET